MIVGRGEEHIFFGDSRGFGNEALHLRSLGGITNIQGEEKGDLFPVGNGNAGGEDGILYRFGGVGAVP